MTSLQKNETGIAHIALVLVAVIVLGGIGFTAYKVTQKKSTNSAVDTALSEAAKAECDKHNDKNLCKFFNSWKASEKYRMTSTDSNGAKSLFEIDGNKTRMLVSGEMAYEVISIDQTTYTKAGEVWYKQSATTPDQTDPSDYKIDFDEPEGDQENDAPEDKTTYKNLGTESCGSLNCFKYEVIDPNNADEKNFIWFDDKDYKLRRSLTESSDGSSDMTFEYDNVSVNEPSPVQELGPNQYIVPGQTEPMTMPSAADFNM